MRKSFRGNTKEEVRQKMLKTQLGVSQGGFVNQSTLTVAEWLDGWLDQI